jgi:hypothetical protein
MPLPPRGNPERPLRLAIRSTRLLGIVFLCFGAISLVPLAFYRARGPGFAFTLFYVLASLVYLTPGIGYIICSVFLSKRQPGAIVATIVLAVLNVLFILFGFGVLLVTVARNNDPLMPYILIPIAIGAIFILALIQLIYHLSKSFEALRHPPTPHGFAPIMFPSTEPVVPKPQEISSFLPPK